MSEKLEHFRHGQRVQTIYGPGTVKRVKMSTSTEAWVKLDQRPDEQHCAFPADDARSNDVLCYADECEAL